ncbi:MAG: phosphopantetheine-binding protein [Pseudomonadota bacterium]
MEVKSRVRAYLSEYIHNHELKDDDDVFALGLVNSLFALQLVMFVENEFEVFVSGSDVNLQNFKSIDAISGFVQQKRSTES